MALDAIALQAVVAELQELLGLRIDKVQQPARDQIVLLLRSRRLLLNAGAGAPRLQLTAVSRENPAEPPMFCMLLRKHLAGARIAAITQPPLERLVRIELDASDELGRAGRRTLVLEAMDRRSNLILLDEDGRIIDSLRRVDADLSATRQVLPGLFYQPPASAGRLPFLDETPEGFQEKFRSAPEEQKLDAFLLDCYFGISPLMARELAFQAAGDVDTRIFQLHSPDLLWNALDGLSQRVRENRFAPVCLLRDGKPLDFACIPVRQYGGAAESVGYASMSELLDAFYDAKERQERARQRGADLLKAASNSRDRLRRKLAAQEKEYAETQNRDRFRVFGDLITANLYRMERGAARLTCENYYEDNALTDIPLDPLLSPQQNAAKYYKRYTKLKTAEKYLRQQMDLARHDLDYLESVLSEIANAETEQDFLDIREELREAGFLKKQSRKQNKKEARKKSRPREFRTSGGFRVLVGRSNRQNDQLTLRDAERQDLWFHTQKIHGSHVILCTGGKTPDDTSLEEAAMLAAWFSQARDSSGVPVDYTPVRNVRKPSGARPGMVVYNTCRTLFVTPDQSLVKARSV